MAVENEWFTIIALSAAQLTITYQLSPTILYNSHCSLIGRAYHAGIRLQALWYITVTSDRSHRTGRQFFIRQSHVNLPGRNIDFDNVSVYNFPILPPAAASGEICPILNPEVPPLKRPSVIKAHSFRDDGILYKR